MRRIMAEWAHFEITVQNYSGGLWLLWVFHTKTLRSRDKLQEECWICHSFSISCLGKWDRSWWWVKRHLFSLHILLWEWNTEGIEAQHKFRFHCSPKLCLSCICQDGVWNSSNIKKVIFLHKWDNDEICGFSGFPASPSLESWVLITWAGARERYQEGSIHPLSCMMPALRSKKIYFFTPFFPILPHWGELFLSFCWGNKKRRRKRILQRKHRCCRFLLCLKRSLNLLHLLL